MAEQERVDAYLNTVNRLEPNIHPIDDGAFLSSAAISLKRIADALEVLAREPKLPHNKELWDRLEQEALAGVQPKTGRHVRSHGGRAAK